MGMVHMPSMPMEGEVGTVDAQPAGGAHFGEHFMIDAYRGSREKLLDRERVQRCLSELPARLGMQKLAEPMVYWAEPNGIKDPGGWSGVVIIVESHISVHTFPGRSFASIDVYTCRSGLPTFEVEAYFREAFDFEELETNFVIRGTKYPTADYAHPVERRSVDRRQGDRRSRDRRIAPRDAPLPHGVTMDRRNSSVSGRRAEDRIARVAS